MSRDVEDHKCYISKGGKIPVKWTAPEVQAQVVMYSCGISVNSCTKMKLG